ncbi:MAG: oxidoreductase [Methyloversatilis discipulorum]|uniref:PDR/VanB family oxidoreductase n=1 Tax=Methyloversatilis discipulorum TaxID=1119528 RepID=UPI0026EA3E0C|nr:PDR/VanB family oxidoreductase [Methyloversatilis discipulorum]MBV5286111.1 oxidoreductase [Methyloversatilis discipulorum]
MATVDTLQVRIARRETEAEGIAGFELGSADGTPLPAFTAGSHIDVMLGDGLIRQYSLCGHPADRSRYRLGVLLDPASRGGSRAMHALAEGATLTIRPPRNHFELAADARSHLLLAGGIGVTPLLCMAEQLAADGADFTMHYCTRSPARTAFRSRLANAAWAGRVSLHHDDGDAAQAFDMKQVLARPEAGIHLYVCGPKGFMDAVLATARGQGWPEAQIHYEFFAGAPVQTDADTDFEVKLAKSGRVVPVRRDQTVAQALAAAGVELPVSCEQGVCGTCLTRVIDGTPDHRDMYMTPAEQAKNDQFTPCCSRSRGPLLVIDL